VVGGGERSLLKGGHEVSMGGGGEGATWRWGG
jgi:hypothetical protein